MAKIAQTFYVDLKVVILFFIVYIHHSQVNSSLVQSGLFRKNDQSEPDCGFIKQENFMFCQSLRALDLNDQMMETLA